MRAVILIIALMLWAVGSAYGQVVVFGDQESKDAIENFDKLYAHKFMHDMPLEDALDCKARNDLIYARHQANEAYSQSPHYRSVKPYSDSLDLFIADKIAEGHMLSEAMTKVALYEVDVSLLTREEVSDIDTRCQQVRSRVFDDLTVFWQNQENRSFIVKMGSDYPLHLAGNSELFDWVQGWPSVSDKENVFRCFSIGMLPYVPVSLKPLGYENRDALIQDVSLIEDHFSPMLYEYMDAPQISNEYRKMRVLASYEQYLEYLAGAKIGIEKCQSLALSNWRPEGL